MSFSSETVVEPKTNGRSRVTNGKTLLPGIDGRSTWYRRFRDLISLHFSDLGGEGEASEAEKSIIRRVAALEVELEMLERQFADTGSASANDLDLYSRVSSTLRRHLEAVGLQRRPREIGSTLDNFIDAVPVTDPEDGNDELEEA